MRNRIVHYKFLLLLCSLFGGLFSLVAGQYYYFDPSTSTAPYQQGCSEDLAVRINTEAHLNGARAGLLRILFDPTHFSYSTSSLASVLQTNLFVASTETFMLNTSPSASPSWINPGVNTQLQIDRYNSSSDYNGTNGLYGTLKFVPLYSPNPYTGTFSFIYNGDTIRTSLSKVGGINIINPIHQNTYLTGSYYVLQHPCTNDTISPLITLPYPANNSTKQSYLSGISLLLTDNAGSAAGVPYVRTGGIWTGNLRSTTDQYGINLDSFNIRISGNGTGKYINGTLFAPSGNLSAVPNGLTWQHLEKNYVMNISGPALFDYGIEKTITMTGNVQDRNSNAVAFSRTFNAPVRPRLIPGSASPSAGDSLVLTNAPLMVSIADDRAGVNSGTIRVTLSGINGTTYGPYVFSGTALSLSGILGTANQPDYAITISGHVLFPSSGDIQVSVYAEDMEGNRDDINDYIFSTKPSCTDLGCCQPVYLQTGITPPFLYTYGTSIHISGGIDPSFSFEGNTGTVDCNMENQGIPLYKGIESDTGSATYLSFFGLPNLIFSGASVRATLSGKTLYLQRIYIPPITGGCIGSCGGGGGGGTLSPDDCTLPSTLACSNAGGIDNSDSYYDGTCCADTQHGAAGCDVTDSLYSQEVTESFQRGYDLNITNKCPISEARLDEGIRRKELAKMMTMFTIQIMGIYPDTHKAGCDAFTDTGDISDEMKFFVKTSCQLDLMGLHPDGYTPKQKFDPEQFVDRAQFGTILSRLIYGDQYNVYAGEIYTWYEKHLKALNGDNIMKKIQDPFMLEKRARILLMLKRTDDDNLVEKYRLVVPAHNGALVLLDNVR